MDGLLLIDKPTGITSFDIIRRLRPVVGVRKIGHAGTLDPAASGLMLILIGSATKRAESLTKLDKEYLATIKLGQTSTTGDSEGEVAAVSDRRPSRKELELALQTFVGRIQQTPSPYSAIKIGGQEAYKRMRRGEEVKMPTRTVTIHELELLEYKYPLLKLRAKVSSGTYIRSLAADLGERLGTGAYLSGLVRTQVGDYLIKGALKLDGITEDEIVAHLQA